MSGRGPLVLLAAVTTIVVVAAASSSSSAAPPKPTPTPGGPMTLKQRLYAQLESLDELTEDQRLTFMLIAYGETGGHWKPTAHNDTASEVAASGRAYDGVAGELAACGRPRSAYVIGSGGRFQRLVPYFAHDLRSIVPCIDPQLVFDGLHDIVSAVANAHALTTRYPSWNRKVSGVRGGWGTPGWLDAPPPEKIAKWRKHAVAVGLGADFLDRELTPFPAATSSMLARLKAGAAVS